MCCVPSLLTLHVQFKLVKSSNSSELIWYFFHVFFNYSCLMLKVCMFVCSFRWNKKKTAFWPTVLTVSLYCFFRTILFDKTNKTKTFDSNHHTFKYLPNDSRWNMGIVVQTITRSRQVTRIEGNIDASHQTCIPCQHNTSTLFIFRE